MTQLLPTLELLSLHVPKCGGSALGTALRNVYSDALLEDYADRPGDPASPMNMDPDGFYARTRDSLPALLRGKRAVHGHFHPKKYQPLRATFRMAIIREPIARLVSHYHYWKTSPRHGHCLHDYFLERDLDLEAFARLPLIRRFYTGVFFAGMTLNDFDFIGQQEDLSKAVARLAQSIGRPLQLGVEKKRDTPEYNRAIAEIGYDSALRDRLASLLADDIRFYDSVRHRWT